MATRYVEVLAIQRPFPIGLDEANRVMFSCNFDALAAAPVGSFDHPPPRRPHFGNPADEFLVQLSVLECHRKRRDHATHPIGVPADRMSVYQERSRTLAERNGRDIRLAG